MCWPAERAAEISSGKRTACAVGYFSTKTSLHFSIDKVAFALANNGIWIKRNAFVKTCHACYLLFQTDYGHLQLLQQLDQTFRKNLEDVQHIKDNIPAHMPVKKVLTK